MMKSKRAYGFFEKTTVLVSVLFYAAGTLIVLLRNWTKGNLDLKSYAGVVLDGFLLPQILFNIFWDSTENVLSHLFYIGTTFFHLLPHACYLYKAYNFILESS